MRALTISRIAMLLAMGSSVFAPLTARAADACVIDSVSLYFSGFIVTAPARSSLPLRGVIDAQCAGSAPAQWQISGTVDPSATCYKSTFSATLDGSGDSVIGTFSTYALSAAGAGTTLAAVTDPARASFELERCATDGVDRITYSLEVPGSNSAVPVGFLTKAS